MERKKRTYRDIPRPVWVVAGILGVLLLVYGGFFVFNYRVDNARNTLSDAHAEPRNSSNSLDAEKQEILDWYETTIDKLETRVDDMEKRTIEGGNEMQDIYQEHLTAMEEELDTLRSQVKQVRRATAEEWEMLKGRVEETRARVEDKLQNDYRDYSVSTE